MVVHSMQVRCDGRVFDVWKIDDDITNIMEFHSAIKEDLVDEDNTFRFDITAYIRGGEHVVNVNSDSSMMQMFNLNTNPTDVILLDVKRVKCIPSAVMPSVNHSDVEDEPVELNVGDDEDEPVELNVGDDEDEGFADVALGDGGFAEHVGVDEDVFDSAEDADNDKNMMSEEYLESEDADFSDPEWKYRRDYSEEEGSSESISDMVISSDDVQLSDNDMEDNVRKKQPNRHEGAIDPNCNIPEGPSHIVQDGKIHLQIWQVFDDYKSFADVLLDYCIQEGFEIKKKKFDRGRVTAICKSEGCHWRIHASKSPVGLSFIIKTFNEEHTCQHVRRNKTATPTWIAKKLVNVLKYDPNMKIEAMRGQLLDLYGIDVENKTLWKARGCFIGCHS